MWIIQEKIFGEETELLVKALEKNSIDYKIVSDNTYRPVKRAIVRGSIDFVESYRHPFIDFYPGGLLTLDNYTYTNYSQYFGNRLLNSDFIVMPWWQLSANPQLIFNAFPETERFFIRPNSGRKVFTGTTLTKLRWDQELAIIKSLPSSSISRDDLVIISSAKKILGEYRCLMYKNELIDYCLYNGEFQMIANIPIKFWAKTIDFFPDTLYTMDLAFTEGSVQLLELNSFVSAGLYDMNYDKIVKRINEIC